MSATPATPAVDVDEKLVLPRWIWAGAAALVAVIVAAMAFAIFEPIQVLPRIRLAPGYALETADGGTLTSEDARGTVTLYSFVTVDCAAGDTCTEAADVVDTVRAIAAQVGTDVDFGDTDFRLVTIAVDAPSEADLAAAATAAGADESETEWVWVTGGAERLRTVAASGFELFYETGEAGEVTRFDQKYVLVDGNGVVRGDYRYDTVASTEDKLTSHAGILAEEIRYASGATALAYEAAHLFLCYP